MSNVFFSASEKNKKNKEIKVFCGELCKTSECTADEINLISETGTGLQRNIIVGLTRFVNNPHSLSDDRIADLLQIAAYVHCADRMSDRGDRHSVNNSGWARSFEFHIPVRDLEFWSKERIRIALNNVLSFMTGDRKYVFNFVQMEKDMLEEKKAQQSMFSKETLI